MRISPDYFKRDDDAEEQDVSPSVSEPPSSQFKEGQEIDGSKIQFVTRAREETGPDGAKRSRVFLSDSYEALVRQIGASSRFKIIKILPCEEGDE